MTDVFSMRSYELGPMAAVEPSLLGDWSIETLERAQRFLFGPHAEVPENFIHFGEDLVKRGLFRLPFQYTIMEFLTNDADSPYLDRIVFLCEQVDMRKREDEPDDIPPMIVLIWPLLRYREGHWMRPPIMLEHESEQPYVLIRAGQPAATSKSQYRWARHYTNDKEGSWQKIGSAALALCPAATAMMMSRSAKIVNVEVPAKLAAARKRSGKPGLFQFHVVAVPSTGRVRGGGLTELPRASPMLHWRRGHYRALAPNRIVPVAPCLVGSKESGAIAKVYDGKTAHRLPVIDENQAG